MRSRTANISLTAELSLAGLASNFQNVMHETLVPLYEMFDGFDAKQKFVKLEIADLQNAMLGMVHTPTHATNLRLADRLQPPVGRLVRPLREGRDGVGKGWR